MELPHQDSSVIPTQEQFITDAKEFLSSLKYPEGSVYVGLHPWAQKAIIHYLEQRSFTIIDHAHRYEQLTANTRADNRGNTQVGHALRRDDGEGTEGG